MKLKIRLTIIIIVMMVVVVAAISGILLTRASAFQSEAAEINLESMTGVYALELKLQYQTILDVLQTLAQIMNDYENVEPALRRTRYTEMIWSLMESRPNFVGIYTVWRPGAIDDRAVELANTPGTDASGNYITWITRESGQMELRAYQDWQNVLSNVKDVPIITDPVRRSVSGKEIYTAGIVVPIIPKETTTVVGLVGMNFDLSVSQEIVEKLKPYGDGRAILLSGNGTVAAHYDASKIGQTAEQVLAPIVGAHGVAVVNESLKTGNPEVFSGNGRICDVYPFYVGESPIPWALLSSVKESTVQASVISLTRFTIILAVAAVVIAAIIIFFIASSIANPILNVSLTLKDISEGEGDLTKSINIKSQDEIGDLAHYFNLTLEKIKKLVITIKKQAVALLDIGNQLASNMTETAAAINEITANIQNIKTRVINQSASVTETNATMEQITVNIDKLNGHIENQTSSVAQSSSAIEEMLANINSVTQTLIKNADNVKDLADASEVGRSGLQEVVADIQEISRESEGLLEINAVMENIASQTNLLSMNAAIEAAHAGDAGKGFAVVADEIRKLAESSGEQSKIISTVLKKIKDSIDKITKSTDAVLNKFEAIDSGVKVVSDQEENIRNAMEEQSTGSQQILEAISRLNNITHMVKGGSLEMLEGSKEVIQESKNLELVTQEITNGMNEMATGADQINIAVNQINTVSGDNKENINILVREVSKFKIE
ncbi:MAG: methyl-accepting chemotaxis protein [Spirochaetaceae bacterium]|jgi:methyl-accepting chemotaxis protein|nr:methyl-accepting chemotaxis protein [Spirochaetaceae bacterium]